MFVNNIKHLLLQITLLTVSWKFCDATTDDGVTQNFDYIIVGGGTAGCTLARRLTDNRKYSVLVLEAGRIPEYQLSIPALLLGTILNGTSDIKFYPTLPQQNASLETGGVVNYLAGRTLGGSSSLNGMMYNRGSPHDYDNWASVTGDQSWSYENLLKYFKRMEDYQGDYPSEQEHGRGGPITISRPRYSPGLNEWLEAGKFLGYPIADPNGPQRISFNPVESNLRFGRRVSAFSGYIRPILGIRKNLKVSLESVVTRIVFDGLRAKGVIFVKDGMEHFVTAAKEVIVSAGVIGSPEILMKSGIGPRKVLESTGLTPVIKYLPVGQNLMDHHALNLDLILSNRSAAYIRERDLNPQTLEFYNRFGDGPYSTYLYRLQAFMASSVATTAPKGKYHHLGPEWADIHLTYGQSPIEYLSTLEEDRITVSNNEVVLSSLVLVTRPKSRGSVTLNQTNPLTSDPIIDLNYYSHPDDMQAMLDGIRETLKIFEETPSFQRLGIRYTTVPIRACQQFPFRSDDYFRCYMRQRTTSGIHAAGTCKMGRIGDPTAVVDPELKVIGIKNLRVVDNSIMPHVTNGNTQAPAYVIGEKAADMILGQPER